MEQTNDVWARLYEAEAFIRAETLMAAAIGTRASHEPLLDELESTCDWVVRDGPAKLAERLTYLLSMVVMFGTASLDTFATEIEIGKLVTADDFQTEPEPDPEAIRDTMLHLLRLQSENLRGQLG